MVKVDLNEVVVEEAERWRRTFAKGEGWGGGGRAAKLLIEVSVVSAAEKAVARVVCEYGKERP